MALSPATILTQESPSALLIYGGGPPPHLESYLHFSWSLARRSGKVGLRVVLLQFPEEESMANLEGLETIVGQLRVERANLVTQLRHVDVALSVLGKLNGGRSYTKPKRSLSASARRKISLAQRAQWAKQSSNGNTGIARRKRTMSTAARRKIAAAQRARWAKVKRQQKAA